MRAYRDRHQLPWDISVTTNVRFEDYQDQNTWRVALYQHVLRRSFEGQDLTPRNGIYLVPNMPVEDFACCIQMNHRSFGRLAARHLHALGYRQVVVMPMKAKPAWRLERQEGFIDEMRQLHVDYTVYNRQEFDRESAGFGENSCPLVASATKSPLPFFVRWMVRPIGCGTGCPRSVCACQTTLL